MLSTSTDDLPLHRGSKSKDTLNVLTEDPNPLLR
jgi:hypothetical protein